jgi:hypothetical protein
MEDWLKNTVPGIILLGAVGSVLSVTLIFFGKFLFRKTGTSLKEFIRNFQYRHGFFMGTLKAKNDLESYFVYFVFRLSTLLVTTVLACTCLVIGVWLSLSGLPFERLALAIFTCSLVGFLSTGIAIAKYIGVQMDYIVLLKEDVDRGLKKSLDKRRKEGMKEVSPSTNPVASSQKNVEKK